MSDGAELRDDRLEEYRGLLAAYGEALEAKDPNARNLLDRAGALWELIVGLGGPESAEMHFVFAFSYATQAGDLLEVERLYAAMGEEDRAATDLADSLKPGSIKTWLRK